MKHISKYLLFICLFFTIESFAQSVKTENGLRSSYTGNSDYKIVQVDPGKGKKVKNVILMIADGMGLTHLSAAWVANNGKMNILDNCMHTGLSKTYCANKLITDSGAAGTAMATGHKTNYHCIGVNPEGNVLQSLTDLANNKGLSTGIVVTCGLTDATPATFCTNNIDRDREEEIALDYLSCNVDFIFGGGRNKFNMRSDNRDLMQEMKERGYQVCYSWQETQLAQEGKVFAVLEDGQLPLADERGDLFNRATQKALKNLAVNKKGFFTMFEGSRIDDCGHENDLFKLIPEIWDFDKTVGEVLKWAEKDGKTLVVILADHETGALTLTDGSLQKGEVTVNFANKGHSGIMVPVYSYGPQSNLFSGVMDNTDVFNKIKSILKL
ncbi:alkaline phosphatase [Labilibaculum antarcticum]|uniref:Alkaline phosphatase n=1 Tax=Labilibaculum antarcticum TaxID=1717717 RepID=A0A1Y1CHW5_9BACT|nr:alkaline phosphatase [Labilibaculum antarcticum]BAX79978.1 alkaline phosphatase [Labilibaculum antarcticum]